MMIANGPSHAIQRGCRVGGNGGQVDVWKIVAEIVIID